MHAKNIRFFAGLVAAGVFSCLAFKDLEWAALRETVALVGLEAVAASLMFLAASFGTRILRWWYMLRKLNNNLSLYRCAWPFIAGLAVNNTLPLRAGDVLRAVGFRSSLQSSSSCVSSTLVVERLMDLLALLLLFFVGFLGVGGNKLPQTFVFLCALAGGLGLVLLLVVFFWPHAVQGICRWCLRRPFVKDRSWAKAAHTWMTEFWQSFALLRSPRLTLKLVALSMMAWIFEGGMFAVVAGSLKMNVGGLAPWFSLSTGTLATLLPSTPGHAGTFDYFAKLGMTVYGTPEGMATAFVIVVHAFLWAPVTVVGWTYLIASQGYKSALEMKTLKDTSIGA